MTQLADTSERYVAAFKAFARNGAAGAPAWLKEMREAAITRFAQLGFPTTKQEEWRFTSVAPIAETTFTLSRGRETRSEEHTSELQSQSNLVCRLLLEKKKKIYILIRCR